VFGNLGLKLRALNEDIELASILTFLIFFPEKSSFYYFMIFSLLMIFFLMRKVLLSRNIGVSNFTKSLVAVNILLLLSTLFSVYFLKSILFVFDIFLISAYFVFHLIEEREEEKNIRIFGMVISIYSTVFLLTLLFSGTRDLFFSNPIMSGITSGAGMLIYLYFFLKENRYPFLIPVILNLSALFVSESKAAFLGAAVFSILMVILKKRKAVPVVIALILLTFIIPNPIRTMFHHSLYRDPYSADRIKIWSIGLKIFHDNPIAGVGADNFGEVAKTYNFKQKAGPANYFKLPRTPHSDYIKLMAETGLFGTAVLLFSLIFILRNILRGPLYNISKILILYLLLQALFFNILFQTFFFFLFIFLLKTLFKGEIEFYNNTGTVKFLTLFILIIVIFTGYISPYLSELQIKESLNRKNTVQVFNRLNRAASLNKANISPYYFKGVLLLSRFRKTSDPQLLYAAMDHVKQVLSINPHYEKAYFLESDIYRSLLEKGLQYPGLENEVTAPLEKLKKIDPFNPFLRMEIAHLYFKFGKKEKAETEARKALDLEPNYIAAMNFLQKQFHYFHTGEAFLSRIRSTLEATKDWHRRNSPYLTGLIKIPEDLQAQLGAASAPLN